MKGFVKWIIGVCTALLIAVIIGAWTLKDEILDKQLIYGLKIESNSEDIKENIEDIKATNKVINSVSNQITTIKSEMATKDDLKRIEELLLWSHSDLKKNTKLLSDEL